MTAELNDGSGRSLGTGQTNTMRKEKRGMLNGPRGLMMRLLRLLRGRGIEIEAKAEIKATAEEQVGVPMDYFAHSRRERARRALGKANKEILDAD